MKFNHKKLHKALVILEKVSDSRHQLVAGSSIRIRTIDSRGEVVRLSAWDGRETLSIDIMTTDVDSIPLGGDLLIPAKSFKDSVRPIGRVEKNAEVDIVTDGAILEVNANGANRKLLGIPSDHDHEINRRVKHISTFPTSEFNLALAFTVPAMSADETRPHICCLAMLSGKMIATDGHRLHTCDLPSADVDSKKVISRNAAQLLLLITKDSESVVMGGDEDDVIFYSGAWVLATKIRDTDFPPWEQVIPKRNDFSITVNPKTTSQSINSVKPKEKGTGLRFSLNGTFKVEDLTRESGASVEIVTIENGHTGEELFQIGVNPQYMIEALAMDSQSAQIAFQGNHDPMVVTSNGKLAVVMPMRV